MDRRADDDKGGEVRSATLALLDRRTPDSTVCPSEVARALAAQRGGKDWRGEMPAVHAEVDKMLAEGLVRLSWKKEAMPVRDGPYRIARAGPDDGRPDG